MHIIMICHFNSVEQEWQIQRKVWKMDFSKLSGIELIKVYGELLREMYAKNLIRSKNVTGDVGEYIVVNHYNKTKGLPKLQFAPPSTKNIDAISVNGERYSIKCTTTNTTGAFYGIEKDVEYSKIKPLFELCSNNQIGQYISNRIDIGN